MNIVTGIRLKALKNILLYLTVNFFIIYMLSVFFSDTEKVIPVAIFICGSLWIAITIVCDIIILINLKTLIKTLDEPIFKKYGSPDQVNYIIADMRNNKIYEDKKILISNKFIFNKKSPRELCAYKDIIAIKNRSQYYKYSGIRYFVTVIDKYGNKLEIFYDEIIWGKNYIDKIIGLIDFRCTNNLDTTNKRINKKNLEKEYHIETIYDYYSYDLDYYYGKMNEVLKKLEYDSFREFKDDVYDVKGIVSNKLFSNDIDEFEFLVQQLGYLDFSHFYYANMEDEEDIDENDE